MFEATLSLSQPQQLLTLFGARDQNLRLVRDALGVSITHRNGQLRVFGDEKEVAQATLSLVLPASSFINGAVLMVDGGLSIQN